MSKQTREFIRHPIDIPIEVSLSQEPCPVHPHLSNISEGGLAFVQEKAYQPGTMLKVRIPFADPAASVRAQVVWCQSRERDYEIGVRFLEPADAYLVRMVEQVCHIEQYKRDIERTEGRRLSGEEAANEWIAKYAGNFPAIH